MCLWIEVWFLELDAGHQQKRGKFAPIARARENPHPTERHDINLLGMEQNTRWNTNGTRLLEAFDRNCYTAHLIYYHRTPLVFTQTTYR